MNTCIDMRLRTAAAAACAAGLACALLAFTPAWAEDLDQYPIPDEFQQEVERTAAEYDEATAAAEKAKAAVDENAERIAELAAQIPDQQERGMKAARELYKLEKQQVGILELFCGSDSLESLITNIDYVSRISDAHARELNQLSEMKSEYDTRQIALKEAKREADKHVRKADAALKEAKEARLEAQKRAQEEAKRQAEEEKRRARQAEAEAARAAAWAQAQAAAQNASRLAAQNIAEQKAQVAQANAAKGPDAGAEDADAAAAADDEPVVNKEDLDEYELAVEEAAAKEEAEAAKAQAEAEAQAAAQDDASASAEGVADGTTAEYIEVDPETLQSEDVVLVDLPIEDGADWGAGREAFIEEWSGRIDAYLAGSALAGQGETFAKAAWDYGVDPRFSPAIACTESGLGSSCFKPHNAWGWGDSSWGSWEEAIDAHVAGLARGYGYTISVGGAQKYCPPNWVYWYNTTLTQMYGI